MARSFALAFATAVAASSVAATDAFAETEALQVDKGHTFITFDVSHFGFSSMLGRFEDYDLTVELDRDDFSNSKVEAIIRTESIDTDHEERDKHLRNADFFDVENHPTMTFVSTDIERTGEDTATMTGDLTILGVTQPVTLDVQLNGEGQHPFDPAIHIVGFDATGVIDRTEFGMDYGVPAIGTEVGIRITTELQRPS